MGSPGAGKTSLLAALLPRLCPPLRAAVIEADLDSRTDADALEALGWKAAQLRTGGFCHMDAAMTEAGLAGLGIPAGAGTDPEAGPVPFDLVILENVGNLICTAQVDTGAHLNLALLSVPEGDDKPLKYPVMFAAADLVVITKADYLDRESFDTGAVAARVMAMNSRRLPSSWSPQGQGREWTTWPAYLLSAIRTSGLPPGIDGPGNDLALPG
jgi:hydrogenase nickel incorporation protein HypB